MFDLAKTEAYYTLGMYWLEKGVWNPDLEDQDINFSEAYKNLKYAAEQSHMLAAYSIATMHWSGLGTYESCDVANSYFEITAM